MERFVRIAALLALAIVILIALVLFVVIPTDKAEWCPNFSVLSCSTE